MHALTDQIALIKKISAVIHYKIVLWQTVPGEKKKSLFPSKSQSRGHSALQFLETQPSLPFFFFMG